MSEVLFETAGSVATITLNRPEQLNAMTLGLMNGITAALEKVAADESLRLVVLTGAGRGFCAGADLTDVAAGNAGSADQLDPGVHPYNRTLQALNECPVPTIARVNGPAAGGGFGLALACDISIAASSAFFVATFGPRLGIVPDMGATWSIPRAVGRARALGITLLGDRISSAQAVDWGLIWGSVPDDELDDEVARVAGILERSSPGTVTRIRQCIDAATDNDFHEQLTLEMAHQAVLIPRNMQEGAKAFVEKRDPVFSGQRDR